MRIAIAGTRGIPARYGGFETFAEELATRFTARGHRVTVYCRERHTEPTYRGAALVYLPTWRHKYFDTIVHTFLCTVHLIFHRCDAALYCNAANVAKSTASNNTTATMPSNRICRRKLILDSAILESTTDLPARALTS